MDIFSPNFLEWNLTQNKWKVTVLPLKITGVNFDSTRANVSIDWSEYVPLLSIHYIIIINSEKRICFIWVKSHSNSSDSAIILLFSSEIALQKRSDYILKYIVLRNIISDYVIFWIKTFASNRYNDFGLIAFSWRQISSNFHSIRCLLLHIDKIFAYLCYNFLFSIQSLFRQYAEICLSGAIRANLTTSKQGRLFGSLFFLLTNANRKTPNATIGSPNHNFFATATSNTL